MNKQLTQEKVKYLWSVHRNKELYGIMDIHKRIVCLFEHQTTREEKFIIMGALKASEQ